MFSEVVGKDIPNRRSEGAAVWLVQWCNLFPDAPLAGHISAVLTDGREDHAGDPVLELTGLRLVGAEDQLVEAGLGNEGGGLEPFTPKQDRGEMLGILSPGLLPLIDGEAPQPLPSALRGIHPEGPTHVRRHEPRVALDLDNPYLAVVEGERDDGEA